jgi:RNA polymerase sigma-70 factor (sigma-E family)
MDDADEAQFRQFVSARSGSLLRTAYLLVGDRGRAEDLVQTALVKTYVAWHRIREATAVEAFVRRVMVNTASSWWRRRSSAERPTAVLPETTVEDHTARQAEADAVRRLLLTLPVRQRAVLVLRFYEDLDEAAIAATLQISRGAVRTHMFRGMTALRSILAEEVRS